MTSSACKCLAIDQPTTFAVSVNSDRQIKPAFVGWCWVMSATHRRSGVLGVNSRCWIGSVARAGPGHVLCFLACVGDGRYEGASRASTGQHAYGEQ